MGNFIFLTVEAPVIPHINFLDAVAPFWLSPDNPVTYFVTSDSYRPGKKTEKFT
jgi:hypothetical protein